jgi:hypothetical protein
VWLLPDGIWPPILDLLTAKRGAVVESRRIVQAEEVGQ